MIPSNSILYLRKNLGYNEKIAIIDIDDHFGDGIAQYFYHDPSVLYFSLHEFDFTQGDIGMFDELGQDEGIGIAELDLEKIFKPFPNLEKDEYYQGTGLGLNICKKIIERHNGEMTVSKGEHTGALNGKILKK